ncbi:MAG: hypothetical protein U9P49_07340 [Thermodesulfobacteriota bacterium]|nr:hypothetical protein [Thermodesulfobacteriota bacterium]
MRQVLYFCIIVIVAALIYGCSSSGPEITYVNTSDAAPVTGQRILLQANSIVDRYPIRYIWAATGGVLEDEDANRYWTYWIAPKDPGEYTVSCTVIDDGDDQETAFFDIDVKQREKKTLLEQGALCMAKDRSAKTGGIWASTNDDIWYFSSSGESNIGWGDKFTAIAIQKYSSYYYYTYHIIWGAVENKIHYYRSSDDTGTMTCEGCGAINAMEVDGSILWVGADNGLYKCSTATYTCEDTTITDTKVCDIYVGEDLTLAATTTGIYTLDADGNTWEVKYSGDTCAVTVDGDGDIWSITDDEVMKENEDKSGLNKLDPQPDYVAASLDIDLLDRIWCGKYYWDGDISTWQDPTGIEESVEESIVSPEGLVYLRSTSGALFCW